MNVVVVVVVEICTKVALGGGGRFTRYGKGLGDKTNQHEFTSYRILYFVLLQGNKKYEEGSADLLDVLRPKGRYAVAGAVGGPIVSLDMRTLYLKDLSFFGCTVLEPQVFGNLIKRIEANEIEPLVAATFPLKDINAAQVAFADKAYTGKIVLSVATEEEA